MVVIQTMKCTICHLDSNNGNGFAMNSNITCRSKGIDQYNPLHIGTKIKNHLLLHEHLGELTKYKGCVKLVKDGDSRGRQKCKNRKIMIGHW